MVFRRKCAIFLDKYHFQLFRECRVLLHHYPAEHRVETLIRAEIITFDIVSSEKMFKSPQQREADWRTRDPEFTDSAAPGFTPGTVWRSRGRNPHLHTRAQSLWSSDYIVVGKMVKTKLVTVAIILFSMSMLPFVLQLSARAAAALCRWSGPTLHYCELDIFLWDYFPPSSQTAVKVFVCSHVTIIYIASKVCVQQPPRKHFW